ncbi:unnamed protein product [Meganyctiphanes norvegica]|uniref:DDE-1 domain-containing protein n=1 Tax=Meganyctiphanes norvegica TaxID=48144 RepID=A0AAV2SV98_MEGNR
MDMGDAAQLVGRYCKKRKKETQFRNDIPGSDFMGKFYKRNKTKISRRRSTSIKIARARSEHPVIISEFFDLLDQAFKTAKVDVKNHSHGGRVFSIDETGYKSKIQTKGFLCPVGRPALVLANSEGKTNFSTLICGNALGEFYPPSVVYKGSNKSLPAGWVMNGPPGTTYNTTKSGWMDQERFLAWLRWFDEKLTEKQVERPVVVVMDGASSHISVDIVEEAREKNIVLVKLPPNSTHFLQALDVGVLVLPR